MSVGSGRVYHANINCSDLERSLGLYRDVLGLTRVAYTAPDTAQVGAAFGLESAQWEAWILGSADASPPSGTVVDLLQWKVPGPVRLDEGAPGTGGAGFRTAVLDRRDPAGQRKSLEDAGVAVAPADAGAGTARPGALAFADPDGTALEMAPADRDAFSGLVVGCSDVAASVPFYRDVLGLSVEPAAAGAGAVLADDSGFRVYLRPAGAGARPGRRPANALGIFRVALLTQDIAADYAELGGAGVHCWSPPADLEMGSGLGSLKAMLFADPDGAAWELIEPGPR